MRIFWRIFAAVLLLAAILGLGVYAYNIGIARGVAQNVQVPAGQVAPAYPLYFGHPFFGFGFGLFACLIPFFLLFLAFGSMRLLFWHGPMGYRHMHRRDWDWRDPENKGVPPFFAEWHRRAHTVPDWDKAPEEKQK